MEIEDYLSDLLDHGAGESLAEVDLDAVLRGGEQLGLRLRRRRRNRIALGVAAAVVGVAVGTFATVGRFHDFDHDEMAAAPSVRSATPTPAAPIAPAEPPASATPIPATPFATPTASAVSIRALDSKEILTTFMKLLPKFAVTLDSTASATKAAAGEGFTDMDVDDGYGAVLAIMRISANTAGTTFACPSGAGYVDEQPRPVGALALGCTTRTLADGSVEVNTVTPTDSEGYYDLIVTLVRSDGVTVSLTLGNGVLSSSAKAAIVTRAQPPLTIAQADQLVESPDWQLTVVVP